MLERRGGGMSGARIGGPNEWGQVTEAYTVVEALIYLEIDSSFVTKEQPTGSY